MSVLSLCEMGSREEGEEVMNWFGVAELPKKDPKKNTPGSRGGHQGNLNENFLNTIIETYNKRNPKLGLCLTKPSKSKKTKPILYRRNHTLLVPDRHLKGVPGYMGIYLQSKSQKSRGSADEKFSADIDDACAGCYPDPVIFIMNLEHSNKNSGTQKKWNTIIEYMKEKANENPNRVIGVFTLSEFALWLEEKCFPYE
jgi:hypothetical protein